jgi:hypothetical protein
MLEGKGTSLSFLPWIRKRVNLLMENARHAFNREFLYFTHFAGYPNGQLELPRLCHKGLTEVGCFKFQPYHDMSTTFNVVVHIFDDF